MKTIAKELNIKEFPFTIKDKNGDELYYEDFTGYWTKREYDSNRNVIYFEESNGYWCKREYDSNENVIYYENFNGYWYKKEYDSNGNEIYYEDSDGEIIDNMDIPHNFDEILEFVVEDVKETADKENWNDADVVIGFRRWIEAQSDNQP